MKPCKIAEGVVGSSGYIRIYLGAGLREYVHRLAWIAVHGPIPKGMTIDHMCQQKTCVEVEHLQVVTRGENCALGHTRMTHCKRGHSFEEFGVVRKSGSRMCRLCSNTRKAEARHGGKNL